MRLIHTQGQTITRLEEEKADLQGELEDCHQIADDLKKEVSTLQEKVADLQTLIKQYLSDIESLKRVIRVQNNTIAAYQTQVNALKDKVLLWEGRFYDWERFRFPIQGLNAKFKRLFDVDQHPGYNRLIIDPKWALIFGVPTTHGHVRTFWNTTIQGDRYRLTDWYEDDTDQQSIVKLHFPTFDDFKVAGPFPSWLGLMRHPGTVVNVEVPGTFPGGIAGLLCGEWDGSPGSGLTLSRFTYQSWYDMGRLLMYWCKDMNYHIESARDTVSDFNGIVKDFLSISLPPPIDNADEETQ